MIGPDLYKCTDRDLILIKPMDVNLEKSVSKNNNKLIFERSYNNTKFESSNLKRLCSDKNNCGNKLQKLSSGRKTLEIIVVNGKWDTSQKIPSVIAEMHTVNLDDSSSWNDDCERKQFSENYSDDSAISLQGSDFTEESEDSDKCSDDPKNLSWLLDFKVDSLFHGLLQDGGCEASPTYVEDECPSGLKKRSSYKEVEVNYIQEHPEEHPQQQHSNKKPPFTYTELIEQALQERGELTVSEIYHWIYQHFPYYKATDDRWKNSVRHNLSINPYFRKGGKVAQGAGHLWRVAKKDDENSYVAMQKRQRMTSYLANTAPVLDEVQLATASIEVKESMDMEKEDSGYEHLLLNSSQDMSLERSAEEILNGVKKDVEVQYLIPSRDATGEDCTVETLTLYPMDPCYPNPDPDFLNPVSKEVVVEESGLSTTSDHLEAPYIITDLNPVSLGLNIEDADAIFANDINFQYYELS